MIWMEDPGEPLTLIDVKCVISLLIKAEALRERGGGQTGSLTCLMGMARPLPMLSARASRPFLSLSVSLAFLDCGPKEITTVIINTDGEQRGAATTTVTCSTCIGLIRQETNGAALCVQRSI